jgi:hypothetical protein
MPTSNAQQNTGTSASRSIRSFLHLQCGASAALLTSKPSAPVNRLTDEFLRAVSGVGSLYRNDSKSSMPGSLDEDVVAKMLSDGARLHDAQQKPPLIATDSILRTRKVQTSVGSVTPRSPSTSERRSRASAAANETSPKAAAATAVPETKRQAPRQQSNILSRQPANFSQRNDLSTATGPGFYTPTMSLQVQRASSSLSEVDDALECSSARRDISAERALTVLSDLAEIRERKADSLERNIERESVSQVAAVVHSTKSSFLLIYPCRCSSAIWPTSRPNLRLYLCVAF